MRNSIICAWLGLFVIQPFAGAVCGLPQPRLVCQEYFAQSAVVVAKLVRVRIVEPNPGEVTGTYYYMEVVQRLKGRVLKRFQVYEENSTGRATFHWKRGEKYLLFLSYSKEDRGWELDGCGNSMPLAGAKNVLDEISRINAGKTRETIQGFFASTESLPERLTVKVTGGGKSRRVMVVNREFRLRVQPGMYVVTTGYPGWRLEKDDFSYDDPQKIRIEAGRCAQIQYQASKVAVTAPSPR
jgi:hypothetical protein